MFVHDVREIAHALIIIYYYNAITLLSMYKIVMPWDFVESVQRTIIIYIHPL